MRLQYFKAMEFVVRQDDELKTKESLGEGSEKMMQAMMLEMPLESLCSIGIMSEDELDHMVEKLN